MKYRTTAFSALTLMVGRQEGHLVYKKLEWWGTGMVICLERDADLHVAQLMPLPLTVAPTYTIIISLQSYLLSYLLLLVFHHPLTLSL